MPFFYLQRIAYTEANYDVKRKASRQEYSICETKKF